MIAPQSPRTFVERLDFLTTTEARATRVITDLAELEPIGRELTLSAVHPAVDVEQVLAATGWELQVSDAARETSPTTDEEFSALRQLVSRD